MPLKAIGNNVLRFGDIGHAEDSSAIQYNIVRVDGQKSVYLPILKQGGNSNTIQIVNGVRDRIKHLLDVPRSLVSSVVFDQSAYVKTAVANVLREGGIGLVLTAIDDPGLPRIDARHDRGAALDSHLLPRCIPAAERHRRHHQHHGARRPGAGALAPDR